MRTKIGIWGMAGVILASFLTGCGAGSNASSAEVDTATQFLQKVYTVQDYESTPGDTQSLRAEFEPYMTEDALDTFMANSYATDAAIMAEILDATVVVIEIIYEAMPDTEGYYQYDAMLEMTTPQETQAVDAPGKIILDEEGLVSYFAPDIPLHLLLTEN